MLNFLMILAIFIAVGGAIYVFFTKNKLRYHRVADFFIGVILVILLTFEIPCALYLFYLAMPNWVIGKMFAFYIFYLFASFGIIQAFYIAPIAIIFAENRHWQKMAGVIAAALSVSAFITLSNIYFPFTF